jgi:IclR family acetate operon transcriptional repressor
MKTQPRSNPANGVQSLHRALDLIEAIFGSGPMTLRDAASRADLAEPTTHRLLNTMVDRGFVRRLPDRRYGLGARLIPMGSSASRQIAGDATIVLGRVEAELGETVNLAVLSGVQAEYVAQVPSSHAMRMFTEVGARVPLHCTGVGKALLAQLEPSAALKLVERLNLERRTEHTLVDRKDLMRNLDLIRARGYALDEQEQELGVRCAAVAFPHPGFGSGAISVSGPVTRMTDSLVAKAVDVLKGSVDDLIRISSTATGA